YRAVESRIEKLADREIDLDRLPDRNTVSAPGDVLEPRAEGFGQRLALGERGDAVGITVDDEGGALNALAQSSTKFTIGLPGEVGIGERLRIGLEPPAEAVLDAFGRVVLEEGLEEPLEEATVVVGIPSPCSPVEVTNGWQALIAHVGSLEKRADRFVPARALRGEHRGGGHEDDLRDALRVLAGEQERPLKAAGQRDDVGPIGTRRVHHRPDVRGVLALRVGFHPSRPVRAAVAARIEHDHAVVPCEPGDLCLPHARVDDGPGRHEQDGLVAPSVDLVEEANAVAIRIALVRGVAGSALLRSRLPIGHDHFPSFAAPGVCARALAPASRPSSQPWIQSSRAWCPWVMPESRSSAKPWAKVITRGTSAAGGKRSA